MTTSMYVGQPKRRGNGDGEQRGKGYWAWGQQGKKSQEIVSRSIVSDSL